MVPTTVVRIVIMSWMIFLIIDQLSFIFICSLIFFNEFTSKQVDKLFAKDNRRFISLNIEHNITLTLT